MSDWKPELYLTFDKERTQPAIDLMTKINYENPSRIIDIGCGPGNSTNVLKTRWAYAEITGLDNSQAMIKQAKKTYKDINWVCADASEDLSNLGKFDIVFSNAAIQWVPEQKPLLTSLFGLLTENGIMAVQVPDTTNMPIHTELQKLVSTSKWEKQFASHAPNHSTHSVDFYYDILCDLTDNIDVWVTKYYHVMNSHGDIVKWYSSTGLRPYLDCIPNENIKNEFLSEFEYMLSKSYSVQKNKKVLFPFTRIFFIAKQEVR